ncbi:MAG: hypothetical protein HFF63_06130 [Oscillospiraceae bacterium]|jgi:hypothetical protein|nr:hypothetical protein [Oscillospiraceae bacterium]
MRRWMTAILACALILAAAGCAQGEPVVKTTIEKTPLEQSEELLANGQEIVLYPYYEMSDGTWQADGRIYQQRLVVTGRLHNAVRDTTYIILSNVGDIPFERAWKASGLSSNMDDYFTAEEALFVAFQ